MSDIERFIWASVVTPAVGGEWVRYTDHQAEVEQLTRQRSENFAEIERLTRARDGLRDSLREALAEVERLKEQVAALTVAVEQADEAKADAEAAAAAEEAETDRVMSERDAAQAEVERLTVRLEHAQARIVPPLPHADESAQQVQDKMDGYIASVTTELHETREKLARVQVQYDEFAKVTAKVIEQHQRERDHARQQVYRLQQACADRPTDQSAQNLDMGNGQAILDSSRPDDETIWREAFMAAVHDVHKNWMDVADVALAQYRKRWPR